MARGHQHVDIGAINAPIVRIVSALAAALGLLWGSMNAYYEIKTQIRELGQLVSQQNDALKGLAGSIKQIADEALTASDLRSACLQMQIQNQSRGWVCPFSGDIPARRASLARQIKQTKE